MKICTVYCSTSTFSHFVVCTSLYILFLYVQLLWNALINLVQKFIPSNSLILNLQITQWYLIQIYTRIQATFNKLNYSSINSISIGFIFLYNSSPTSCTFLFSVSMLLIKYKSKMVENKFSFTFNFPPSTISSRSLLTASL